MIEIFGIIILSFVAFIILKFNNNLKIIILSILFFPHVFVDKTGWIFYQNFKDIYLYLCSLFLYFNYLNTKNKENPSLIFYFNCIVAICLIVPIINFLYNYNSIVISTSFIKNFILSLILPISLAVIFFVTIINFDKKKIENFFVNYYFIMFIIFCEFLISLIFKYYFNFNIISKIYPDNIFRSFFINGHIATSHYFIFAYFLGFYFYIKKNSNIYLLINFLFVTVIFYNIESRLTIFSFIFTNLIFLYYSLTKNIFSEKSLLKYFTIYAGLITILIMIINVYFKENLSPSILNDYNLSFIKFDLWLTPIVERINTNIFYIHSLISNIGIGFGYNNAGSYGIVNNIDFIPKLFNYNFDNFSYSLHHGYGFANFHGEISRIHSGVLNILVSFGIFSLALSLIFYKIIKLSIFSFKNNDKFFEIILITFLFFLCSSLVNYLYEIEMLILLILSSYLIFRKKNEN